MLEDFFYKYFLSPGYNLVNTTVYALLLIAGLYAIFLILKKFRIHVEKKLVIGIAPFILFGSSMRVLVDSKIFQSHLFVSPTIYAVVTIIIGICMSASILIERKFKISYHKTLFATGMILSLFPLSMIGVVNFYGAALVILFLLPWIALLKIAEWPSENKLVFFLQMFDATTTFTSVNFFGYSEQHVLPSSFISIFGPFSFVVIKALAVALILILIDKYCKDKELKKYLKLTIGILGAATGTRDFLRMLAFT